MTHFFPLNIKLLLPKFRFSSLAVNKTDKKNHLALKRLSCFHYNNTKHRQCIAANHWWKKKRERTFRKRKNEIVFTEIIYKLIDWVFQVWELETFCFFFVLEKKTIKIKFQSFEVARIGLWVCENYRFENFLKFIFQKFLCHFDRQSQGSQRKIKCSFRHMFDQCVFVHSNKIIWH